MGFVEIEPLSKKEICLLSETLGRNQSIISDYIPAKVYKYGSPARFCIPACILYKTFFFAKGTEFFLLVPMIEDKTLISSDNRNRSIALTTSASKLLELILQNRISTYIYTSDEIGFKAFRNIGMAIFSFKESVKIHLISGSPACSDLLS